MKLYACKGKDREGAVWLDDTPREIRLSFNQYRTLCEALNRYVSDQNIGPPKPEVRRLERYIVSSWKKLDKEAPSRLD